MTQVVNISLWNMKGESIDPLTIVAVERAVEIAVAKREKVTGERVLTQTNKD